MGHPWVRSEPVQRHRDETNPTRSRVLRSNILGGNELYVPSSRKRPRRGRNEPTAVPRAVSPDSRTKRSQIGAGWPGPSQPAAPAPGTERTERVSVGVVQANSMAEH